MFLFVALIDTIYYQCRCLFEVFPSIGGTNEVQPSTSCNLKSHNKHDYRLTMEGQHSVGLNARTHLAKYNFTCKIINIAGSSEGIDEYCVRTDTNSISNDTKQKLLKKYAYLPGKLSI